MQLQARMSPSLHYVIATHSGGSQALQWDLVIPQENRRIKETP